MTLTFISDLQDGTYLWAGHIQSIVQAIQGKYVVSGCNVHPSSGMTLTVDSGVIYYDKSRYVVSSTNVTIDSNSSGHPRADLIVWNFSTTAIEVLKGSSYWSDGSNEFPIAPVPSDNHVILAVVVVVDGATEIADGDVYDLRVGAEYSTNRLVQLALDDTQTSVTGTTYSEVKTFRFAKVSSYSDIETIIVIASLWTTASGYARLKVYIDSTEYLALGTAETSEHVVTGVIDVSGLSDGLHDVSIMLANDVSGKTTYHKYLNVLGDI